HYTNETSVAPALPPEPSPTGNSNTNAAQLLSHELVEQRSSDTESQLADIDSQRDPPSQPPQMQSTLQEASGQMVGQIFRTLAKEFHILVCGSPRVGKSTLINAICGRKVAETKDGLASCTKTMRCYTIEGQCEIDANITHYKYNFWDTPGFESCDKDDIRSEVKKIVKTPESKPLCMIFCASPGTFVDLAQLEWLLNLCISQKHIFCALVCTNKYAGQAKSRRAVLNDKGLLSKYVNDPPREENDIVFYGNVGLCTSVNSQPFEADDRTLPASDTSE
ncbi:unnamed protein product, partial [Didymodactylos carnosus]